VRPARAILFWVVVIAGLILIEVGELTHLFTLPIQSAFGNLVSFFFALVFTTILALVGAIFLGIYISHRLYATTGFTPFEEEMLKMRSDVQRLRADVTELRAALGSVTPARPDPPEAKK
jgi:uncharacterized membrane protein (DUF106 family)